MAEQPFTKHSVNTDALATLGTIITANEGRDAIHIAVYPVQAAEALCPGDHVGLLDTDGNAEWCAPGDPFAVGIVDPFITGKISKGQWFWLLVYPRQITSLRHVWEHPSFPASGPMEPAVLETSDSEIAKEASRLWLEDFCNNSDVPSFHTTIGAALAQYDDEYVHFSGVDAHGEIPAEFWHHLEIYTGEKLHGTNRAQWFTCSC